MKSLSFENLKKLDALCDDAIYEWKEQGVAGMMLYPDGSGHFLISYQGYSILEVGYYNEEIGWGPVYRKLDDEDLPNPEWKDDIDKLEKILIKFLE